MEAIKKNWLSPIFSALAVLVVSYLAVIPRIEERQNGHEQIHGIERAAQVRQWDSVDNKMIAYQIQLNTVLDKVTELTIINQKIETIADTKVRSIEGRLDSMEHRLK